MATAVSGLCISMGRVMRIERGFLEPDPVGLGVLLVTSLSPLTLEEVVKALGHLGAPSWRPVGEVVVGTVERLIERRLIAPCGAPGTEALAPTAAARLRLPGMLRALPMSSPSPDVAYKLKLMGLDLLEGAMRTAQLRELIGHWRGMLALWEGAERRCPCTQPSVRRWMRHNVLLARMEIDWLAGIALQSAEDVAAE